VKIILLAIFFPPTNVIGAVRPYQFAKKLSEIGHDVTVITLMDEIREDKNYDVNLSSINVIYLKRRKIVADLYPSINNKPKHHFVKKLYRSLLYPDFYILKNNQFQEQLETYVVNNGTPNIIMSMGLPFSLHKIAYNFKKKYPEVKWIADNRDLWANSPYRRSAMFIRYKDRFYEKKLFSKAELVLVVTHHMKTMMSRYLDNSIEVVRNGFSQSLLNKNPAPHCKDIVYAGTLYSGFRDLSTVFNALNEIHYNEVIKFYGSERNEVSKYQSFFTELNIEYNPKVSKKEIENILDNAKYLIIALGSGDFEKGVLTGKLFDYIRSRRKIIALCDEDSELAHIINDYNLGLATRSKEKIKNYLINNNSFVNEVSIDLSIESQLLKLEDLISKI